MPSKDNDIAIIGLSLHLPQAKDIDEFLLNLQQGKTTLSSIPAARIELQSLLKSHLPEGAKRGAFIEGISEFDASFFNISPSEAELMDPQQRLALQTVWHAIENAGYSPNELAKHQTSVFWGVSGTDYYDLIIKANILSPHVPTGNTHSVLANRISYLLNLSGASEPINAGNASSLVAVHNAVLAIQKGDCDLAIVGGVNLLIDPLKFEILAAKNKLSLTGDFKTFENVEANIVRGEGVVAMLLKPLKKAMADQDQIYAVIKGTAVNYSDPINIQSAQQAKTTVITKALERGQVTPDTIQYIEVEQGNSFELSVLKQVFPKSSNAYCGLGTIKSKIGHLEAAAGLASLVAAVLALQNKTFPSAGPTRLNNELKDSPFYLLTQPLQWKVLQDENQQIIPKRAGVANFDEAGTNAFVILEEAPAPVSLPVKEKPYYAVALSATTDKALRQKIIDLQQWLQNPENQTVSLANLSYTLNVGREHFKKRCVFITDNLTSLQNMLNEVIEGRMPENSYFQAIVNDALFESIDENKINSLINTLNEDTSSSALAYKDTVTQLAKAYLNVLPIEWKQLYPDTYARIPLPTYPFEKSKFWLKGEDKEAKVNISEEKTLRASISQLNLWPLYKPQPQNIAYVIPLVKLLSAKLTESLLNQSLNYVIARHAALRTALIEVNDTIQQVIKPQAQFKIDIIDLDERKISKQEDIVKVLTEQVQRRFDLNKAPLMHAALLKRKNGKHLFSLNLSHFICDGTSPIQIITEMAEICQCLLNQQPITLAERAPGFDELTEYQYREYSNRLEEQSNFLKAMFSLASMMPLPQDYPVSQPPVLWGKYLGTIIEKDLFKKVTSFCLAHHVSTYTFFLGIFTLFFSLYADTRRVYLMTIRSGRTQPQTREMIGYIADALPINIDCGENYNLLEYFTQVQETVLFALENYQTPMLFSDWQAAGFVRPQLAYNHFKIEPDDEFFESDELFSPTAIIKYLNKIPYWDYYQPQEYYLMIREHKDFFNFDLIYRNDMFSEKRLLALNEAMINLIQAILKMPQCSIKDLKENFLVIQNL